MGFYTGFTEKYPFFCDCQEKKPRSNITLINSRRGAKPTRNLNIDTQGTIGPFFPRFSRLESPSRAVYLCTSDSLLKLLAKKALMLKENPICSHYVRYF